MKKRRLSQNEEAIRGILLIVVFIVGVIFLRDILVKRRVNILMLTELDYINAAEYYMQKKYADIMTYVSNSDYTIRILTDKKSKNIEKDFRKVCDTFLDKNLQSNKLYVLYVTKEDLDKFEEYRMDYIFNKCDYYYRISRLYDRVDKTWLDDIDILEGDKDYGK